MAYLDEALASYSRTDIYPFHMPGHKRRGPDFPEPYSIDITEIDGFDNLHHAQGILKEAQERAAALYGSKRCYYLINGSTCGLLAAICAAAGKRGRVLMARNCHRAAYHAMFLNELSPVYLFPEIAANGLQGQITPGQVREALKANRDVRAVVVTSPTYEGILSDIAGIAEAAHAFGVPLIVDSAHGAHLGFGFGFPESAVRLGADAVVMSLHKTLPSLTQTALLHVNSDRIPAGRVEKYLAIFQTSSPSYVLMAGMDACVRLLREEGAERFSRYRALLDGFYRDVADLKRLHVLLPGELGRDAAYAWDDSKLVIFLDEESMDGESMDGERLYRLLLEKYHLQMEMASVAYVLGMTGIMDSEDGFRRLSAALHEIDAEIATGKPGAAEEVRGKSRERKPAPSGREASRQAAGKSAWPVEGGMKTASLYEPNERRMELHKAMELPGREVSFEDAVGEVSADFVFLYPPGIPMLVPGEAVSQELVEKIRSCLKRGLRVEGCGSLALGRMRII